MRHAKYSTGGIRNLNLVSEPIVVMNEGTGALVETQSTVGLSPEGPLRLALP